MFRVTARPFKPGRSFVLARSLENVKGEHRRELLHFRSPNNLGVRRRNGRQRHIEFAILVDCCECRLCLGKRSDCVSSSLGGGQLRRPAVSMIPNAVFPAFDLNQPAGNSALVMRLPARV